MFVSLQFKLEFENRQDKANPAFTSVIGSLKYAPHPSVPKRSWEMAKAGKWVSSFWLWGNVARLYWVNNWTKPNGLN